jgi:hypothetical protein
LQIRNDAGVLVSTTRLTDQFLGELNPTLSNGKQMQSGVTQIVFADGVIWDRFRMAMQVADPRDTSGVYAGSGSGDLTGASWLKPDEPLLALSNSKVAKAMRGANDNKSSIWPVRPLIISMEMAA